MVKKTNIRQKKQDLFACQEFGGFMYLLSNKIQFLKIVLANRPTGEMILTT